MKWLLLILPFATQAQTYADSLRLWETSVKELRDFMQAQDEYRVLPHGGEIANTLMEVGVSGEIKPIGYVRFKSLIGGQVFKVYKYAKPHRQAAAHHPPENDLQREGQHIQPWVGVPNLKIISDRRRGRLEPFAIENRRGERIAYGETPSLNFQYEK